MLLSEFLQEIKKLVKASPKLRGLTAIKQKEIRKKLQELIDDLDSLIEETAEDSKLENLKGQTIYIWSDGACSGNPGPGGWASIIEVDGERTTLSGGSPQTTNNIMEMTAALEAIKKTPEGSQIILTTDSQYLLKGMTQWLNGWKRKNWKKSDGKPVLNQEIWKSLDKESSKRDIQWEWVRGHSGHDENELCDQLARNEIEKY